MNNLRKEENGPKQIPCRDHVHGNLVGVWEQSWQIFCFIQLSNLVIFIQSFSYQYCNMPESRVFLCQMM